MSFVAMVSRVDGRDGKICIVTIQYTAIPMQPERKNHTAALRYVIAGSNCSWQFVRWRSGIRPQTQAWTELSDPSLHTNTLGRNTAFTDLESEPGRFPRKNSDLFRVEPNALT